MRDYQAEIARQAELLREAGIPVGPPDPPKGWRDRLMAEAAAGQRHGQPVTEPVVEAWQDTLLREQGIDVAMPTQTDRADAWLVGVKRMTDLRDQASTEHGVSAEERRELDELWRRYTPVKPPRMPTSYAACMEQIVATKARLDDPRTGDSTYNRLSWLFADLINLLATKVEAHEWIGDARLKDVLDPVVDSAHRSASPPTS
jgi:uncharacterized protein with von Willebrand factor type A (vWA) domain